ncbi:P-loop containing nucleoside triphosphate hydrolase protein [Cokeromyces recurvatus]|uniref:P-loop containing nucleoside triphosphate hydrolase protein n=1 Tax=Cokeromyces recurvatus TaxID=90255 RepID=UPI00221E6747|nr:P-loop containing nucleoside triphosphate hydrolase protein [Cokeromyces recurvatus]KAI7900257.1 P-loop containing nucleoside triphosphate hydrolase protein [Cokeromyces recurvatus]
MFSALITKPKVTNIENYIRLFSTTSIVYSKRSSLRKPNISSLTKHLKPDGLNGRQRRDRLRESLKSKNSSNAPYIPVKRRLEKIQNDSSALLKRNSREASSILENHQQVTSNVKQLSAFLANRQFDDLGLSEKTLLAVRTILETKNVKDPKPTEIQALAIPQIIDHRKRHLLVAAETGSGKTLTYLLPIIDMLKADEMKKVPVKRRLDHPRAIILVPTRELVNQVVKTCKSLSHIIKFRAVGFGGRTSRGLVAETLESSPVDILVTTPTTLISYQKEKIISLIDTRYLIIDEADSLFDGGWGEECQQIIQNIQKITERSKTSEKIIIVSATLPRSVNNTLDHLFPQLNKITTPSLHKALPNLKQSFVDLQRFQGNRQLALLEVLKKNIKDDKTLIFCNTKKSVELLHKFLETKNIKALALYKDAPMNRSEALELFSKLNEEGDESNYKILISTDIASRGIDTTFVDHVILFDFPTSVVDYLHRVGRAARAGQVGKATSLIGRKDRMMADRIKRSIRDGAIMT